MTHSLIFFLHAFTCFAMTGAIWIVQLVHYPSFAYISKDKFEAFNVFHQASITYVVMPLMLVEIATGAALVYLTSYHPTYLVLLLLTGLIWLSTFFLSVPYHGELLNGYSSETINKLVLTNWPRTILWSLRSALLLYIMTSSLDWLSLVRAS